MRVKNSAVLADFVYEKLWEKILTRQIKCGEKIQEQSLEKELGISRTPVREAVRRLSDDGIVQIFPNRHAEVIAFDQRMIHDLGMVRVTMDCLAGQLAIQNGSNRDFDELKDISEQCEQAKKEKQLIRQIRLDSQFHMKLAEICENQVLIGTHRSLMLRTELLQSTMLDTGAVHDDVEGHRAILNALYDRDLSAVMQSICRHLCPFYGLKAEEVHPLIFND